MGMEKHILSKMESMLIVGGTSGLGCELAKKYSALGHAVVVTGRKDPEIPKIQYIHLPIGDNTDAVIQHVDAAMSQLDTINTVIFAAGFYQEGHIDSLDDRKIVEMINVGLLVPALLVKRLKNNAGKPVNIIMITSSSQYTPRELEPVYTSIKAGLGMLGESFSLDSGIGKVLVVAPSGMKTPFWSVGKDTSGYLDVTWVAEEITKQFEGFYKYRFVKIHRNPPSVEIVQTRD